MHYRLLAHCVAVLHVLTILFFLLGGLASLLVPTIGYFHFPLAVWVCAAFICGWKCPLTGLENRLLRAGGALGHDTTFTDRLLATLKSRREKPATSPSHVGLGRQRERKLGIAFTVWNLLLYAAHLPAIFEAMATTTSGAGREFPSGLGLARHKDEERSNPLVSHMRIEKRPRVTGQ